MPMAVTYTVCNGEILAENRNGVRKAYVPDSLGSTIALRDSTGAITDTWEYWPYGEVRTRTGTTPTPFQYVGTLGYYTDFTGNVYIRARSYQPRTTRWMSVDPLWPWQRSFVYCDATPATTIDPAGMQAFRINPWDLFIDPTPPRIDLEFLCSLGCNEKVGPCKHESSAFGKSKGNDMTNALGHCMTACCIQRRYPECVWYWNIREVGAVFGHNASCMDEWNNHFGYACASGPASCYACCLANVNNLTWFEPRRHNWPPPMGGCSGWHEPGYGMPCHGKICPDGSHLKRPTCECVWD